MTRALFCGDRNWTAYKPIEDVIRRLEAGSTVIHGDNGLLGPDGKPIRGADKIAGYIAEQYGLTVEVYPYLSEWGRAGGPIRNAQMLSRMPDIVYAFHDRLGASRGTRDMLRQTQRRGVEWRLIDSQGQLRARADVLRLL